MGRKLRILGCIQLVIVITVSSVYFSLFHQPPPEEILENQNAQVNPKSFELDPLKAHTMAEIAEAAWEKWIYQHGYVPVGSIYDGPCGNAENVLIGKLVLLIDPETDQLKVRLCSNTSFDDPIYFGKINIIVHYNDNEFYNNARDLCDADEQLKCPMRRGIHLFLKDWKVPPLLPKGKYDIKGWVTNQKDKTVMCVLTTLNI